MSFRVCHVVPHLPPAQEGIGLYALTLAGELRRNEGIESAFVVASPRWRPGAGTPQGAVALDERTAEGLRAAVARCGPVDRVLLHYVGYGYQEEGLPFWLLRAVRELPVPVVIAYHEMWATGPFWKKVFYTVPFQKAIARRLLRAASGAYTTVGCYDRLLRSLQRPDEDKVVGPISGFGLRPGARQEKNGEGLRLLLYGLPFTRLLAIRAHRALLRRWNGAGAIGKIVVMGRASDGGEMAELAALGIAPDRIESRIDLPEEALREVLAGADLYLTGYRACLIGKSTTVLSALASGCPVLAVDGRDAEPLREGVQFFSPDEFRRAQSPSPSQNDLPSRERLAEVGEAGRRWWETEGAPERVAAKIAALLRRTEG